MTNTNFDSEIIFNAEKVYVHHWPLDAPKWTSITEKKIDADLNKNKKKKNIMIQNNLVKIDNYVFNDLKKIGVTIPFFKKETTMIFEARFNENYGHVHITTREPDYLRIFNNLMAWKEGLLD